MIRTGQTTSTSTLEMLVTVRRFEEEVRRLQLSASIEGAVHLATGHEAVSVGVGMAVAPDDWVACTYRGHGHALMRGVPPRALMAEMLGRSTGVCGGRSGSMNIVAQDHHLLGSFGVIGGSIAAATGAGLSLRGTGTVAVAFFGDGAANQGYFLECLNLAGALALPVLFVCENNLYSEYTRTDQVMAADGIAARARGVGIQTEVVDGMDVRAVAALVGPTLRSIRDGGGPTFIEANTYRFVPHSTADPIKVQGDEEVAHYRARDPIDQERARLIDEGEDPDGIEALMQRVAQDVAAAIRAAFDDPFPEAASLAGGEFR